MENKKLFILGGVLLVLAILAYFLTASHGEKVSTVKLPEKLFEIDSAYVDKLEIQHKGINLVIVKDGREWRVTSPYNARVYGTLVPQALSNLRNMKLSSIVSDNETRNLLYGFSDTLQALVKVYQSGQLKGEFILGNSAPSGVQSYIKKPDAKEIYLAENVLRYNFVKANEYEWRDKIITSIPAGNIKSIDFTLPDESFSIVKDSIGRFKVGADTVVADTMNIYLNLLQNMNTQTFSDTTLADGTKFDYTIKVNAGEETVFNILKLSTTPESYLMKVTGRDDIFKFNFNLFKNIVRSKKNFTGI